MKKIVLFYALLLWVAGGCTDKVLVGDTDGPVGSIPPGSKGYIAVNIVSEGSGGPSTRAWSDDPAGDSDFDAGSDDESELCTTSDSHWVLLFNNDSSFHSMSELTGRTPTDVPLDEEHRHIYEKSLGTYAAEVKIGENGEMPTKCLVVLNARPGRIDDLKGKLAQSPDTWFLPDGVTKAANAAQYVLASLTRTLSDADIAEGGTSVVLFTPGGLTGKDAVNYCTMSSTTYVEGDVHTLETINDANISASVEDAQAHALTVHVERLAAKVEVTVPADAKRYGQTGSGWNEETDGPAWPVVFYPSGETNKLPQMGDSDGDGTYKADSLQWACVLWGWGVNALARREYMFKNLNDAMTGADGKATAAGFQRYADGKVKDGGFFSNWNDSAHHRSYWAVDGYYADPDEYPLQYRKVFDEEKDSSYLQKFPDLGLDGKRSENSPLYYYTYRELRLRAMGFSPDDEGSHEINGNLLGSRKYRYIPENVLGQELLEGNTYRAASTHVLFMGQLLLGEEVDNFATWYGNGGTPEEVMEKVSDKYRSTNYWYDKAGFMQRAYTDVYTKLSSGESRSFENIFGGKDIITTPSGKATLTVQKEDGSDPKQLTGEFMKDLATQGKLDGDENPFDLVPAEIADGDGRVLLGLKKGWELEIKVDEGGQTLKLDGTQFKSASFAFATYADFYKNGRMYYYTPIRYARANADIKPDDYKVGDIGVVRNHWYQVKVKSVLKPGVPVANPEQPIIPNIDPEQHIWAWTSISCHGTW